MLDYDRALIVGEGRVLEDGSPNELLARPMGFFSALYRYRDVHPTTRIYNSSSCVRHKNLDGNISGHECPKGAKDEVKQARRAVT